MAYSIIAGKIINNRFVKDKDTPTPGSFSVYQIDRKDNLLPEDSETFIDLESNLVSAFNKSASYLYYDLRNDCLCVNAFQIASSLGNAAQKWNTLPTDTHTNGMMLCKVNISTVTDYPPAKDLTTGAFARWIDSQGNKIVLTSKVAVELNTDAVSDNELDSIVGSYFIGVKTAPSYDPNDITLLGSLLFTANQDVGLGALAGSCLIGISDNTTKKLVGLSHLGMIVKNTRSDAMSVTDNGTLTPTVTTSVSTSVGRISQKAVSIANYMLANPSGNNGDNDFYVMKAVLGDPNFIQLPDNLYSYYPGTKIVYHKGFMVDSFVNGFDAPSYDFSTYQGTVGTVQDFADSIPSGKNADLSIMHDRSSIIGKTLKYTKFKRNSMQAFASNVSITLGEATYITKQVNWNTSPVLKRDDPKLISYSVYANLIDTSTNKPVEIIDKTDRYMLESPDGLNLVSTLCSRFDSNNEGFYKLPGSTFFVFGDRYSGTQMPLNFNTDSDPLSDTVFNTPSAGNFRFGINTIGLVPSQLLDVGLEIYSVTSSQDLNVFVDKSDNNAVKSLGDNGTDDAPVGCQIIGASQLLTGTTAPRSFNTGNSTSYYKFVPTLTDSDYISGINTSLYYAPNNAAQTRIISDSFPLPSDAVLFDSIVVRKP